MNELGKKLESCRVNVNLSREKAAELIGVSPESVRQWEKGITQPRLDTLLTIAIVYRTKMSDIMQSFDDYVISSVELTGNNLVGEEDFKSDFKLLTLSNRHSEEIVVKINGIVQEILDAMVKFIFRRHCPNFSLCDYPSDNYTKLYEKNGEKNYYCKFYSVPGSENGHCLNCPNDCIMKCEMSESKYDDFYKTYYSIFIKDKYLLGYNELQRREFVLDVFHGVSKDVMYLILMFFMYSDSMRQGLNLDGSNYCLGDICHNDCVHDVRLKRILEDYNI